MRYDAYRLPGVKWISPGIGKGAPQPDCWPSHVVIEGVRVKTVRGNSWGLHRAYYVCPVCGEKRTRLYSGWVPVGMKDNFGIPAGRPVDPSEHFAVRVACAKHWAREHIARDSSELAAQRVREKREKYRPGSPNWQATDAQARDLDNAQIVE